METKKNTLLIIDAYGFVFRAFHVLPPLTNKEGLQLGAVYGFTSMLLKVLNNFKPEHVVVVFDAGGKNFRHKIYNEYKAHRPPVPKDLLDQLDIMREVATSLNFPIIEKVGYEADDIIATIATHMSSLEENIVIISSDKDLMQLINHNIKMYDPMKDQYVSEEMVIKKFGVGPENVREVMALIGDSSDNIPGIRGIGPKTAALLIQEFGSVKKLLDRVDKISNVRHRNMINESRDSALISWELVGLDCNVDLEFTINSLKFTNPSSDKISSFLVKYGFKSLHKRVEDLFKIKIIDNQIIPSIIKNNIIILELTKEQEISSLIKEIEHHGLFSIYLTRDKKQILHIIIAIDNKSYVIAETHLSDYSLLPEIFRLLADKSIKKITWKLKTLLKFCDSKANITSCEDLELMQYSFSAGTKQHGPFKDVDDETEPLTVAGIISSFQENYNKLLIDIRTNGSLNLYEEIDLPLCYVINKMEQAGVKLDEKYLNQLSQEFGDEIQKLELEIFDQVGTKFNIASPKQLGAVLFEKMQLPFGKLSPKSKTYSTSAEILEKLSENGLLIGDLLLRWRGLSKLKNTYTDTLPKQIDQVTGRVHTSFLQTSTTTGRLSSQDPNLQNVPIRSKEGNKIRAAFIAEPQCKLISADYSQIELRILSHIADIPMLKQAFESGEDIHTQTACRIFKINKDQITSEYRRKAKAINFGIIYGISPFGLTKQLNISQTEASDYIKKYFEEYPGILEYMERTKIYARENGYVSNVFGRKCFVTSINDKNHNIRQFAERAAINAPIQSTSADIIKIAMLNLDRKITELKLDTKLILQIHDELLFEAPIHEVEIILPIIKTIMKDSSPLSVPMVVDARVGNNWMEIH